MKDYSAVRIQRHRHFIQFQTVNQEPICQDKLRFLKTMNVSIDTTQIYDLCYFNDKGTKAEIVLRETP